mgnify:CR=1 FL=1
MYIENELKYALIVYIILKCINVLFKYKFQYSLIITYLVSLLSISNFTQVIIPKIMSYIPRVMLEGGMKYTMSKKMIGGNDIFHQNLGYVSNHTRGNAIDLVISPAGNNNIQKVEDILHGISGSPSNVRSDGVTVFRFINEYTHLSAAGTGDHFHITVHPDPPDNRESTSRAAKSIRLVSNNSVRDRPFA